MLLSLLEFKWSSVDGACAPLLWVESRRQPLSHIACLRLRLKQAADVLSDPAKRKDYDKSLRLANEEAGGGGRAQRRAAAAAAAGAAAGGSSSSSAQKFWEELEVKPGSMLDLPCPACGDWHPAEVLDLKP